MLPETVIAAGRGYGNFPRLPFVSTYAYHGNVYASGIGNATPEGDRVFARTITPVPNSGYKFAYWTDKEGNILSTATSLDFIYPEHPS